MGLLNIIEVTFMSRRQKPGPRPIHCFDYIHLIEIQLQVNEKYGGKCKRSNEQNKRTPSLPPSTPLTLICMLLPRSGPTPDSCTENALCPNETGMPTSSSNDAFSSSYGFVGITIVIILATLGFTTWLYLSRRRAYQAESKELQRATGLLEDVESKTPRVPLTLFGIGKRKKKLLSASELAIVSNSPKDAEGSTTSLLFLDPPTRISTSEKGKQPCCTSKSGMRKELVKEVSGGMVVYTTPDKKPSRPKPAAQPLRTNGLGRGSLDLG